MKCGTNFVNDIFNKKKIDDSEEFYNFQVKFSIISCNGKTFLWYGFVRHHTFRQLCYRIVIFVVYNDTIVNIVESILSNQITLYSISIHTYGTFKLVICAHTQTIPSFTMIVKMSNIVYFFRSRVSSHRLSSSIKIRAIYQHAVSTTHVTCSWEYL